MIAMILKQTLQKKLIDMKIKKKSNQISQQSNISIESLCSYLSRKYHVDYFQNEVWSLR